MRKLLTVILSVIAIGCLGSAAACHTHQYSDEWTSDETYHWHAATCGHDDETADQAAHTWVESETEDGETIYVCSVCGYQHTHTYSSAWTSDETYHWHASTCGHDSVSGYDEHIFDDDGVCEVCGYDEADDAEYEIYFSYYTDDNDSGTYGDSTYDDSGNTVSDTYRGVVYTAVEYSGCVLVDVDGDALLKGEKFAFTVQKSVFCYYTDSHSYPVVEVFYEDSDGVINSDIIDPDENGVYVVTVEGSTVITVTNVETTESTISGSGTENNPYTINSVVDWLYFASVINDKDWYGISYNIAYWELTGDLDFEGESVYIVGDGYTTSYSMFMGNFNGNGYTLKNFTIDNSVYDSEGTYSTYVGVFGILSGYVGVDTCIMNLNLENYTIDAGASVDSAVSAGGVVGFIAGASVVNCHVENCTINITADDDYPAYAGGITGLCQSGYSETEGVIFYTSIQYCSADTDISGTGYVYEIGGIAGRVIPYNSISPVFIYNNYSSGTYTDAAHAGGIVAHAGRYTSIQNCYSTADITASCSETSVVSGYEGTALDDRYGYAGGIVGYAENDTIIANCFYKDGTLVASATLGSSYTATGDIVALYSASGFEDYRASEVLLINNLGKSDTVTDSVLKDTLGWSTADWVFGSGYPTINTESAENTFTITLKVGSETYTYEIDSLYRPLSYWYLMAQTSEGDYISQYVTSGVNSTYGYFFDSALTQRVPDCYVPMGDITLYAAYASLSDVAGEYIISSNGITATLVLDIDGTYELSYGAIYLSGNYEYNGEYITMTDSYFSRFASSATSTQQETYFSFWAEKDANGDLAIYDCDVVVEVTETYDTYGFTYLARMFAKSSPLVAVASANAEICGDYYSGNNTFTFNIGYTGTAVITGGSRPLTYYYEDGVLKVLINNAVLYTAEITNGKISVLINSNGVTVYTLTAYDDFEGTWEQSATINKKYTFDGKDSWEYYVDGVLVAEGNYEVNGNGELTFTRGDITVTVTINSDGTLSVKESTGSVGVTYFGEGGYQGTWYTAALSGNRYTLTLSGIDGSGSGVLNLSGAGVSISDMHYVSDGGVLYAYDGDTLYAMLTYDEDTALMAGLFYDSSYDMLSISYTFYLYDDFYGDWFSSIEGIKKLSFNGFGAYNTAASVDDGLIAVSGSVVINGTDTVSYGLNESGEYQFTYNGVTYTIAYDENNNEVTVAYGNYSDKLIAGDSLYGVSYEVNGETYVFDGAGNLTEGGTVAITSESSTIEAVYKIDSATGDITITYNGSVYRTFKAVEEDGEIAGYSVTVGGETYTAKVVNYYSGEWVVVGGYVTFVIPEINYYVAGTVIDLTVYYTSASYTNYPLSASYDGSTLWIYYDTYTTYYMNYVYGYMFMTTTYDPFEETSDNLLSMCESDGWCRTYENASGDTVALGGDSLFVDYEGYGDALLTIDGEETECLYIVDANGNITIYIDEEDENGDVEMVAIYTFNISSSGYGYNGEYRELVEI